MMTDSINKPHAIYSVSLLVYTYILSIHIVYIYTETYKLIHTYIQRKKRGEKNPMVIIQNTG